MLTSWPVFIFPVFVILFMLTSKNDTGELPYVAVASLIFDFFSGYRFGFFTFAILAVVLAIFLFKTRFNVDPRSLFSLAVYTLLFIFAYFATLLIKSDLRLMISQAPVIIIQAMAIFLIFTFASRKLTKTV